MRQSIATTWRRVKYRYNLVGGKCSSCNKVYFPPRAICPGCRRAGVMSDFKLGTGGKVVSFSVVHVAQEGYELMTPYILAIVELDHGVRLTTQIVECNADDVRIGMPVKMVVRKLVEDGEEGLIHYGYKFRPETGISDAHGR